MRRRTKLGIGGAAAVVAIGAGSFLGIAAAGSGDDDHAADRRHAATARCGPRSRDRRRHGPETEAGDDGAAYEVEVRKADGSRSRCSSTPTSTSPGSAADDDGGGDQDDD